MFRFAMLVAFLVAAVPPSARGQDADEVKRLKARVEALEKENAALKAQVAELEKGNKAAPRAGGKAAKLLLAAGTTLEGIYARDEVKPGGKKVEKLNADARLEIKARDKEKYEGELWISNAKLGIKVEGTVGQSGAVTMSFLKDLVGDGKLRKDLIGEGRGKGTLKDNELTMKITIPDVAFEADLRVKVKK